MRIVSLCPSVTELICDLGLADDLVGVTRYCVHPTAAVEKIEKVGGTKDPRIERIVELAPDVVLLNQEENRREDAEALERAGLRLHVTMPRTPAETAAMVREVGSLLERGEAAERIARDIEEASERVRRDARGRPAVRWAYLIWRKPWMTINSDTFVDALLTQAGGRNVFGDRTDRYPEVTAEEIAAADPAAVFLPTEPFPFEDKHVDELSEATGLGRERFRRVDGELLSWHGSRTPRGIDYAERVIREAAEFSAEGRETRGAV